MSDNDYWGRSACGCITAWASERYSTREDVERFESEMRIAGREVVRGTRAQYLDQLDSCPHGRDEAA